MHILQVSPMGYSPASLIGGGEKYVLYVDHALRRTAAEKNVRLSTTVLSLDAGAATIIAEHEISHQTIQGRAWDPFSIDARELIEHLEKADVVYVHQCLCHVGLFVAAHARLLGKRIVGMDAGGGEYHLLKNNPNIVRVYDALHAISRFAEKGFSDFDVPVHVIPGPVDTDSYPLSSELRDTNMVLAVGRILPHKGFERIIASLPSSLSLTIVGNPYDQAYLDFLRNRARGKNVTFLTSDISDADLKGMLRRAGLFVHASTHTDYLGRYYHKPELLGLAPLEALSTGLTTLVSNAGALPELAELPGCHAFSSDVELSRLVDAFSRGSLASEPPQVIRDAVVERYGLLQFGEKLLTLMRVH